jgi:hypothetical protein
MTDAIEKAIAAGAVASLRRRAERQRQRAADWTVTGANGVRIMAGEGRIAERIAHALDKAADEIEAQLCEAPLGTPLELVDGVLLKEETA